MVYAVLDLQMTCGKHVNTDNRQIIRISAVIEDTTNQKQHIVDLFVKPVLSKINSFCTQLTGITDNDFTTNNTFRNQIMKLSRQTSNCSKIFVWGDQDKIQLSNQVIRNYFKFKPFQIKSLFKLISKIQNIQQYYKYYSKNQPCSVQNATIFLGSQFIGTKHNSVDDAINTNKIYKLLKNKINITNNL